MNITQDIQSLRRAFAILETLGHPGTTILPAISAELELPLSSVHRTVGGLVALGYAVRHGRGRYGIGPAALALTREVTLHQVISHSGRPLLVELARRCRACAHLGVLENDMVTYLVKQPFGRTRIFSAENTQLEAYCTGLGKVLLSHLPQADLARYLAQGSFVSLTPRTITDPALLQRELGEIRRRGWALDDEEMSKGLRCVAVPLFDDRNRAIAAISVSGFNSDRLDEIRQHAEATAQQLSHRLYPRGAERADGRVPPED